MDEGLPQTRVSEAVTPREYRGWSISWDYGQFTATGPNYDASWEGEEDGWVDNGEIVFARTIEDLHEEIDEYLADKGSEPRICPTCDGSGDVHRADGEWLGICDCSATTRVTQSHDSPGGYNDKS